MKMEEKKKRWPKVSVAVITYNQKEYLRECLESILEQNYPNIEIVVADDGSKDGTHEMLREYDLKYKGLFKLILSEVNQGITSNHNNAYFACIGEYIAWIGGDDIMLPNRLKKQAQVLEENKKYSMCVTAVDVFNSETNKTIMIGESTKNGKTEYGPEDIISGNCVYAPAVMTRRSMCPSEGFDKRIPVASDWLFWIETSMNGPVVVLDDVLTRYRRHRNNITNNFGIDIDPYLTLQIVEYKYPEYFKYLRRGRVWIDFQRAIYFSRNGDMESCRALCRNVWLYKKNIKILIKILILNLPNNKWSKYIKDKFFKLNIVGEY